MMFQPTSVFPCCERYDVVVDFTGLTGKWYADCRRGALCS